MLTRKNGSLSPKTILKSSAVAGLAAVMLMSGLPAGITLSQAAPVKVNAPQVASFANVVDAVSPAVVSVRVQSNVQTASDDSGPSFGFGGRGFDSLPEDHPLKRFFREFGGPGMGGPDGKDRPRDRADRPHGKGPLRPTSQGSGFFISEDGYLVTNNHVVADGAAYTVVLNDGTELDAKLVGKDSRTDLAVLKVDANRKFTYVQFADDSKVRVGDWVVAVGNPFGLGGTVTAGIVSARGRDIGAGPYDDFIQVDAAVNRGNSGGPTFNLEGEVVGINTAIFSPGGGGNVGIAFAIPANTAKDVVASLIKNGKIERGWLGVQIQPVTKDIAESLGLAEASGALVVSPTENSPGEKAGMKQGDIVTAVNGDTVKDARDLARKIASYSPGTEVEVAIWRGGKAETLKVKLGELPVDKTAAASDDEGSSEQAPAAAQQEIGKLGVSVVPSSDGKGLDIVDVDPDSEAAARGLKSGEKISAINNQPVKSAEEAAKLVEAARKDGRGKALFQIESDQGSRFVALPINQG